ncbi:hypothetical protein TorRG33x02_274510 [Trema orientale]|uniref:Uncharacterized protein n=1 Tax=Trema orientale TaxID=63057 RepID=A0A2P5CST1_TREOI|nr:hypothetical protein TorRG33x02_274510 [Trema orientale]
MNRRFHINVYAEEEEDQDTSFGLGEDQRDMHPQYSLSFSTSYGGGTTLALLSHSTSSITIPRMNSIAHYLHHLQTNSGRPTRLFRTAPSPPC